MNSNNGKQAALRAVMVFALASAAAADNAGVDPRKRIEVSDSTFACIAEMTPVRGFYVANLLGKQEDTLKVARSESGGRYPPGSVVQLIPAEVMVKHHEGWNPPTNDWEFFELAVAEAGSKIKVRGGAEVVNKSGVSCFGCHVQAKPQWDLICEKDHGCTPLPVTAERIRAVQQADPRCRKPAQQEAVKPRESG